MHPSPLQLLCEDWNIKGRQKNQNQQTNKKQPSNTHKIRTLYKKKFDGKYQTATFIYLFIIFHSKNSRPLNPKFFKYGMSLTCNVKPTEVTAH